MIEFYLIDPTVWQFSPNENSIFVGEYLSLDEAIAEATRKYGGDWQKSEEIKAYSPKDKNKWLEIVKENIKESLNEE